MPEKPTDLKMVPMHAGPVDAKTAEHEEKRNSCPAKVKKVDKQRFVAVGGEIPYPIYPWQVPMKIDHGYVAEKNQENCQAA